jgi:2'-5' RNA ligase
MSAAAEPAARVFFALVPPPGVQRLLGELARDVARRAHGRPVPAENMHVTLAFVGAWPIARLPMLLDAAKRIQGEPMRVTLDRLGTFPRAGVAWVGPSLVPDALTRLAASLADALSAAGVKLDAQPYRPHVTLARHCHGLCAKRAAGPFRFDADRFVLMQSQTRSEGARYRELAHWPLQSQSSPPT